MKFLCVGCDEPMSLVETKGPDRGSMTVVFACPVCGRQTAMLTNSSETQVVRSLGVKIGGRTLEAEPMEGIRTGLLSAAVDADASDGSSKCPFTGMVNDAYERESIPWTDAARTRIERIPAYARRMVVQGVEDFARSEGYPEVTETVLDEARDGLGM